MFRLYRRITQNVANTSVDQILDLIAGVYFNITGICDLNRLHPTPPLPPPAPFFFFLASSRLNAPPNIEICQSNKHFHALNIAWL